MLWVDFTGRNQRVKGIELSWLLLIERRRWHRMWALANSPLSGEYFAVLQRHIESAIEQAMSDTPVVLLNGARQTGKTTLAQAIADRTGAQYFTLDDAATLGLAAGDPNGFIRNLKGPVVIDEIQKAEELFPAIKLAVDRDRQPGRFLLTGSANILTLPRLSDSLAGRMEVIPLFPLSAGELLGHPEEFVPLLFDGKLGQSRLRRDKVDLAAALARGGYPETLQRSSDARRSAWFASYISTILQRDVRDLAQVDGLHALPNLLKLLAARGSGLLNVSDVGRDAGLPHSTLTRYLALLETVFLVHRLPAWSHNLGQRLVKAPKVHLIDSGLACHLLGANAGRLAEDRPLFGRLLESYIVGELRKQISWAAPGMGLYHYRTATGSEVDVLLEDRSGAICGVEVKASATVGPSDFSALKALQEQLPNRFRTGVVLYSGDQIVPYGDHLWLMPVHALWTC
jgi:predicted AAA+ superfamily ATPase